MESINKLIELFINHFGSEPESLKKLSASGSARVYYILEKDETIALGALNQDVAENMAFFEFSTHFHDCGLPVPKIFAIHPDKDAYLIEYLGDTTLFSFLTTHRTENILSEQTLDYYRKTLYWLPRFQVEAGKTINYSASYPRAAFDKQSMQWDLNYFKYYFVKLSGVSFNEQALENDFQRLIDFLLEAPSDFFLYRDLQSRNIMVCDEDVYFIDYQGGRKGALQYDIASLLWDAKADIPHKVRKELLETYLNELSQIIDIDKDDFKKYYYAFVLVRILQALGTYGYRGFYERKSHFLQSIPYALKNLQWIFENIRFNVEIQELTNVLHQAIHSTYLQEISKQTKTRLTVSIFSFSYRKGIPYDPTGNGGGHVFDCRILPNPGKEPQFQNLTGCDKEVKSFLDANSEAEALFKNVKDIVIQSVESYTERGFSNLMINFGCTGGQHRSVYFAERTACFLRENFPDINVVLHHCEQKQLNERP